MNFIFIKTRGSLNAYILFPSKTSANGRRWTGILAVGRQREQFRILISCSVRVDIVLEDVCPVLTQSPWVIVVVRRTPIVVVASVCLLVPFVIVEPFDDIVIEINSSIQPIRFKNSATVRGVTAEAALRALLEDNPAFSINNKIYARSRHVGDD